MLKWLQELFKQEEPMTKAEVIERFYRGEWDD